MDLIDLHRGKKVMMVTIDVVTDAIETPEEVADILRKALQFVDSDKLYPCADCGMAPLSRCVARGKLAALSANSPRTDVREVQKIAKRGDEGNGLVCRRRIS